MHLRVFLREFWWDFSEGVCIQKIGYTNYHSFGKWSLER